MLNQVPTQGILAGKVEVNSNQLDNKQGGIYSVSSQVLNVVNQLENTQGELFSEGIFVFRVKALP